MRSNWHQHNSIGLVLLGSQDRCLGTAIQFNAMQFNQSKQIKCSIFVFSYFIFNSLCEGCHLPSAGFQGVPSLKIYWGPTGCLKKIVRRLIDCSYTRVLTVATAAGWVAEWRGVSGRMAYTVFVRWLKLSSVKWCQTPDGWPRRPDLTTHLIALRKGR